MVVHTAEKKKSIFLKFNCVKSHSSMCKLLLDFPAAIIIFFSPFREVQGLEMYYSMNDHHIR